MKCKMVFNDFGLLTCMLATLVVIVPAKRVNADSCGGEWQCLWLGPEPATSFYEKCEDQCEYGLHCRSDVEISMNYEQPLCSVENLWGEDGYRQCCLSVEDIVETTRTPCIRDISKPCSTPYPGCVKGGCYDGLDYQCKVDPNRTPTVYYTDGWQTNLSACTP